MTASLVKSVAVSVMCRGALTSTARATIFRQRKHSSSPSVIVRARPPPSLILSRNRLPFATILTAAPYLEPVPTFSLPVIVTPIWTPTVTCLILTMERARVRTSLWEIIILPFRIMKFLRQLANRSI
uniref:Uncharacterized protein n=1 Tax=Cacopsylla melanoneura TaxID=428564 RepID=A0A8D9AXT7_9HEMI